MARFFDTLVIGLLWGPSVFVTYLASREFSPVTVTAIRVAVASTILLLILRKQNLRLPRAAKTWCHFSVMGFVSLALPWTLWGFARPHLSCAVSSTINGLVPIVTLLGAHRFLRDERLNWSRLLGVGLGLAGFLCLCSPSLAGGNLQGSLLGICLTLTATLSSGLAIVYGRRFLTSMPPLLASTGQLTSCCVYLVPLALIVEPISSSDPVTWTGIAAITWLGVVATAFGITWSFRVMRHSGAGTLGMAFYLIPLVGSALGVAFFREEIHWTGYIATILIFTGLALVQKKLDLLLPE